MSAPAAGLPEMVQEAESLAQRLGFLSEASLALLAQQNTEGLLEVLAEQALLRERIEPLTAHLLSARAALPHDDALEDPLLRIAESLRRAQRAGESLREELEDARARLGERIDTAHHRAGAVAGYGDIDVRTSTGFTRTG